MKGYAHTQVRPLAPAICHSRTWLPTPCMPVRAGRDLRGALLTLLLPVVAVVAVLSILKLNIDPTAPQLLLQLPVLGQPGPLLLANPPSALGACVVSRYPVTNQFWSTGARTNPRRARPAPVAFCLSGSQARAVMLAAASTSSRCRAMSTVDFLRGKDDR